MAGKRKSSLPQKADEERRQLMSWSMSDLFEASDQDAGGTRSGVEEETSSSPATSAPSPNKKLKSRLKRAKVAGETVATLDERLQFMIDDCDCYVVIHKNEPSEWSGKLCTVTFQLLGVSVAFVGIMEVLLDTVSEFWIYVNKYSNQLIVYLEIGGGGGTESGGRTQRESQKKAIYFEAESHLSPDILEGMKLKDFWLKYSGWHKATCTISVDVFIVEQILMPLKIGSTAVKLRKCHAVVAQLVKEFYGLDHLDFTGLKFTKKHNIEELYEEVKHRHLAESRDLKVNVQHPGLLPRLRPYQKEAVLWMLSREKYHLPHDDWPRDPLTDLFQELVLLDGKTLFYNRHTGILLREMPQTENRVLGGILADEMGLGKTVEVLACILLHRRSCLPSVAPLPVYETDLHKPKKRRLEKYSTAQQRRNDRYRSFASGGANNNTLNGNRDQGICKSTVSAQTAFQDHTYFRRTDLTPSQRNHPSGSSVTGSAFANNRLVLPENHLVEISSSDRPQDGNTLNDVVENVEISSGNLTFSTIYQAAVDEASSGSLVDPGLPCFLENPSESSSVERSELTLECICGSYDVSRIKSRVVRCQKCGMRQHASCVNYDLSDSYRGCYLCPHCLVAEVPVPSGATLIIAPFSILDQWIEEIQKHTQAEALKLFVYTGVHKKGFVQPRTLAKQDIVIVTYDTLRKEIDYVDLPHTYDEGNRKFRHPKRFLAIPSPITAVEWWRVCLDEAQQVECTTTKTAEMASRLSAINRWCVTGTPIQRGLDDLFGLFVFLRVDPYWFRLWWAKVLYEPYCYSLREPLYSAVTKVLWRNSKRDVYDQICLPPQTIDIHWLTFSPIEEHFYRRLYQECAQEAMANLSKWTDCNVKLNSLDKYALQQLLNPLLRLRQACCHPQAVRGEFLPINKSTLTMEELLTQLSKKAKVECEEAQRQIIAASNGLAGLLIICKEHAAAVGEYREVLRLVEEHKGQVRTDDLQLLHTVHNLQEMLALAPPGIGHTLRDSQLKDQEVEVRQRYMAKMEGQVTSARVGWNSHRKSVSTLKKQLKSGNEWWSDLIQWVIDIHLDEYLIEKVKLDLSENKTVCATIRRFHSAQGLRYVLYDQLKTLNSCHESLVSNIVQLDSVPTPEVIHQTVECCLRPGISQMHSCPFCHSDKLFKAYEDKLFSFVDKGLLEDNTVSDEESGVHVSTRRQGTWAESDTEKSLKSLIAFAAKYSGDKGLIEYGHAHLKLFEALKKEFKFLRQMWLALREQVSSLDELNMATTRMRLRLSNEMPTDPPQRNIIEPSELSQQRLKLKSDRLLAQNELRQKKSQLLYLHNLAEAHSTFNNGLNPELCPICRHKLGAQWSVLQCGHCFCIRCIRILIDRYSFGGLHRTLGCAICRQRTRYADVSYVSTRMPDSAGEDEDAIRVKGDHSTKVDGVIRCLLQIQRMDSNAKVLVFSTWQDVLDILSQALRDNDISFRSLHSHNKFQENLQSFKYDRSIQVLLLPVHSGANGLNLTEASHVLLIEPILNPAQELQAIGRVHRIGQTKPIKVHRFLVRSTIEERMHSLLETIEIPLESHKNDETTLTIGNLNDLFMMVPDVDIDEETENQNAENFV